MTIEVTVLISIVTAIGGFMLSYFKFGSDRAKDIQSEGRQDGVMLTELGYIKANTDEIKAEQKEQRTLNNDFRERLTAVESSAKQAHHRIDRQEERIDRIEEHHDQHIH